jgi:hypothetical protein
MGLLETSFFIQCIVTSTLRLCIIVEIVDVILNISQSLWNRIYIVTNASIKEVILFQDLNVKIVCLTFTNLFKMMTINVYNKNIIYFNIKK